MLKTRLAIIFVAAPVIAHGERLSDTVSISPSTVSFRANGTGEEDQAVVTLTNDSVHHGIAVRSIRTTGSEWFRVPNIGIPHYEIGPQQTFDVVVAYTPHNCKKHTGALTVDIEYGSETIANIRKDAEDRFGKPMRAEKQRLADLERAGPNFGPIELLEMRTRLEWERKKRALVVDLHKKRAAVPELEDEMQIVLEEMRLGKYCSKCHRSARQIEKEEKKPFAEHLTEVTGTPVPASDEMIEQKTQEYQAKIAAAKAAAEAAEKLLLGEEQLFAASLDEIQRKRKQARELFDQDVARLKRNIADLRVSYERDLTAAEAMENAKAKVTATLKGVCTQR